MLDRKFEMRAGVGSDWVANRTVCLSSRLATAATAGSVDDNIFTTVWMLFSVRRSVRPRPPARLATKM